MTPSESSSFGIAWLTNTAASTALVGSWADPICMCVDYDRNLSSCLYCDEHVSMGVRCGYEGACEYMWV